MRRRFVHALAASCLLAVACDPALDGNSLGDQCDLNTHCEAPLVCRMSRCRRECATIRDCPIGSRCVLDEAGLGSCLLEDEASCEATEDCPGPLVCAERECVNECDAERSCPPGARCNDDGRCGDVQGHVCQYDSECAPGLRCGPDGRCRVQCIEDRDCPDESECVAGSCARIRLDAGMDAGIDGGADGGLDAAMADGGPPPLPPVRCLDGGVCDPAPSATLTCVAGYCAVDACDPPFLDCDGEIRNGCETNPETHRAHCGGCGNPCGAGEVCLGGGCVTATIEQIATGDSSTCALWSTNQVTCWGRNDSGQLGDGVGGVDRPVPVMVTGVIDATAVAVGGYHACVVHADGTVSCWGDDSRGQLGDGGATVTGESSSAPGAVPGLADVAGISAGTHHTCVWRTDGTAACWGDNYWGQVGDGSDRNRHSSPVAVTTLTDVTAVAAGDRHNCALTSTGDARCWGYGATGGLGNGATGSEPAPVAVVMPGGVTFDQLVGLGSNSYARASDGRPFCWGSGSQYACATGTSASLDTPTESALLGTVDRVAGRCALLADRTLRCWGNNADGQAGIGTTETPLDVPQVPPITGVRAISTSLAHTCVLLDTGSIRCAGRDRNGQLGDGMPGPSPTARFSPVVGLP